MEPLNFCRQMKTQFLDRLEVQSERNRQLFSHAIDLSILSKKFCLPDGGYVFVDEQFRGLDFDSVNIPFDHIALEFFAEINGSKFRHIMFCTDRVKRIEVGIAESINGKWGYSPLIFSISKSNPIRREDGKIKFNDMLVGLDYTPEEIYPEVYTLLQFLNVLSCSNVRTETYIPKHCKKLKSALPFDEYHFLTIDCPKRQAAATGHHIDERRHPREHLRRGHIRRLENGNRIWVNSTIVNHGVGGKISKDYGVRDPRAKMVEALSR